MNSLSVSGKSWILKKYNQEDLTFIKENFSLDEITSKLLSIRNIKKEEINSFLNPSIKNFLPNPNNLIDMEKSTLRTVKAISNNEKIGIFGDYDVDGATSTALLGNYFSELGLNYEIYISDNMLEEYDGLTAGGKRKGLYRRRCKIDDCRLPLLKKLFDAVHYFNYG